MTLPDRELNRYRHALALALLANAAARLEAALDRLEHTRTRKDATP